MCTPSAAKRLLRCCWVVALGVSGRRGAGGGGAFSLELMCWALVRRARARAASTSLGCRSETSGWWKGRHDVRGTAGSDGSGAAACERARSAAATCRSRSRSQSWRGCCSRSGMRSRRAWALHLHGSVAAIDTALSGPGRACTAARQGRALQARIHQALETASVWGDLQAPASHMMAPQGFRCDDSAGQAQRRPEFASDR